MILICRYWSFPIYLRVSAVPQGLGLGEHYRGRHSKDSWNPNKWAILRASKAERNGSEDISDMDRQKWREREAREQILSFMNSSNNMDWVDIAAVSWDGEFTGKNVNGNKGDQIYFQAYC